MNDKDKEREEVFLTESDALLTDYNENGHERQQQHRKTRSVDDFGDYNKPPLPRFGGLHRAKQPHSLAHLTESMRELLPAIAEDIVENVQQVRRSFVKKLDDFDQGETGFLDMSLTRSLSIIPDDISVFVEEIVPEPELPVLVTSGPPLLQYLSLLIAVLAISSNATALHLLVGVQSPMKLYWRMTASYIVLSIFAIRHVIKDGFPALTLGNWLTFLAAVSCYSIHTLLFVTALEYTAIGNALIFANSQALLLVIGKIFVGERIHVLEAMGVVVAFSGAIVCASEEGTATDAIPSKSGYIGDGLALCSAIGGVGYLTFAKTVRSQMPVTVFMFSVMFVGSFLVLFYMMMNQTIHVEFSLNPYYGVLGWLNLTEFRLPILIHLAVVVNCIGTMGFVRAMAFFENVVIAVATLLEPMLASFIAHAFGVGPLPGVRGWSGNVLVAMGTLCVIYPALGKKNDAAAH